MKKRIALIVGLVCLTIFSLIACNKTKDEHALVLHEEVVATCTSNGNEAYYTCSHCDKTFNADKQEIDSVPTVSALGHNYELKVGTPSTCCTKGVITHYECSACKKLFDLLKDEISSVEASLDGYNHDKDATYSIAKKPNKLNYYVGEQFDTAGMVVSSKCQKCNGVILDNQYLTVLYQETNANVFSLGDSEVTLIYGDVTLTLEGITVIKPEVVLYGVQSSYVTSCNTPIDLSGITTNVIGAEVKCEYIKGATIKVSPFDLEKGSYKVRIYVEDTENYYGVEQTVTLTVDHNYKKYEDSKMVGLVCTCKNAIFSIENGKVVYVDENSPSIDLGSLVKGNVDFTISSLKKLSGNTQTDVSATNQGNVYSYSKDLFDNSKLTLLVTYLIDGEEYKVKVESKFSRMRVDLQIGKMQSAGIQNEHGDVYNVTQDDGLVENPDQRPLTAFNRGELSSYLEDGYDYFEFWIYNPTQTGYTIHLAGDGENGWMDSSSFDISLPAKTWTKVTISKSDILHNNYGTWYLYILGGNSDGAKQPGWQVTTVYAVKS